MTSTIKMQLDDPQCEPYKKHKWDAGVDLRSNNEDFELEPGEQIEVHTGVRVKIPPRFAGIVIPRSGLGTKYRVQLANTVGCIDSGYTGEIIVHLYNNGEKSLFVNKYDRFCQLLVIPVLVATYRIVSELETTQRGSGGFGHTGVV